MAEIAIETLHGGLRVLRAEEPPPTVQVRMVRQDPAVAGGILWAVHAETYVRVADLPEAVQAAVRAAVGAIPAEAVRQRMGEGTRAEVDREQARAAQAREEENDG